MENYPNGEKSLPLQLHPQQAQPQGAFSNNGDWQNMSVIHQAVFNHLVVKEIFNNLSVPDLLNVSSVNKLWNFIGREVLRDNKKCVAKIKGNNPCDNLKTLNVLLRRSSSIPFNGYSITIGGNHTCIDVECGNPAHFYPFLYNEINSKYLQLDWKNTAGGNCPAKQFIKALLVDKGGNLVELSLLKLPRTIMSFSEYFGFEKEGNQEFLPNLKLLELPRATRNYAQASLTEELVLAAPKLEKISGAVLPDFLEFIASKNKIEAVTEFVFLPESQAVIIQGDRNEDNQIEKWLKTSLEVFSWQSPKIQKMVISTERMRRMVRDRRDWSIVMLSTIFRHLFLRSCRLVEKLKIYHPDLIFVGHSQFGIISEPLVRLTHLTVEFAGSVDVNESYLTLSRINFSCMCPNLQSVYLIFFADSCEPETYLGNEFREKVVEYTCPTVSQLKLRFNRDSLKAVNNIEIFIRRLAKNFPNVRSLKLDIAVSGKFEKFCSSLWPAWPDLENLTFTIFNDHLVKKNLDYCFTGIEKSLCDHLLQTKKYDDFQRFVWRSSICDLKKLKNLRIKIYHWNECQQDERFMNEIFLSEVTGNCAFSLMPELSVEIALNECQNDSGVQCCLALEHLKPFVKFVDWNAAIDWGRFGDE